MDLKTIPFDGIEQALVEEKESKIEQSIYNTKFHSLAEISVEVPGITHHPPDNMQPWMRLSPWLDLVLESQGIPDADLHCIELPRSFATQLLFASQVGLYMGRLSESDVEDMRDGFPRTTTRGISLDDLFNGGQKFFPRLDTCSLKDALAGKGPVGEVEDIWMRLATSARGVHGIRALRDEDPLRPVYLYLFPWIYRMEPEREYRVFCPPSGSRVAAISQYRWTEPWCYASVPEHKRASAARKIAEGIKDIHQRIIIHPAMTEKLKERGFVFDVIEDGTDKHGVQLIELNHFGALSGCGSCLFHWIKDARALYGTHGELEFRVAA